METPAILELSFPSFSEFSGSLGNRELIYHFCDVLSHRIVLNEEPDNPFQRLLLPLSLTSYPLLNAIYCFAGAHLECMGVQIEEKSANFHSLALKGLSEMIGQDGNREEILATIMLLVYYEALVQKNPAHIIHQHLSGARYVLSTVPEKSQTIAFLERAFDFYDVITALSLGKAPLSTAPAPGTLQPLCLSPPSSFPRRNLDPLLGMATDLWPTLHRLSNVLAMKQELEAVRIDGFHSKAVVLRTEYEVMTTAIEDILGKWEPAVPAAFLGNNDGELYSGGVQTACDSSRLQAALHNALAYRFASLVFLQRNIYGYSQHHREVQKNVHSVLVHCFDTISSGGPVSALLWPMFVAACEALSDPDRNLAVQVFRETEKQQRMVNIKHAWEIVTKVWAITDASGCEERNMVIWRDVAEEMGLNIILG
ncbi:hypothetical protein GQ53DRAFT_633085 [Thozetella sp. PMI_491]|nr:hypothetical protein GQ53DRAFT_633085 [Thozetella sp. PMI_491]